MEIFITIHGDSITLIYLRQVILAEVVAAYFPALVELHNYSPAHSVQQKMYNFDTLNQRVLKKLGFQIPRPVIEDIVNCRPGAIENVLNALQFKMAKYREKKLQKEGKSLQGSPVSSVPEKVRNEAPVERKKFEGQAAQHQKEKALSNNQKAEAVPGANIPAKGGGAQIRVDEELLQEKEQHIRELQETIEILELKLAKLEQLVHLKDNKIQKLLQISSNSAM